MFYLGVVILGTVLFRGRYIWYSVISHRQPKAMADRTRDDGVEEKTEEQRLLLYKGVRVRVPNLHRDQNRWRGPGRDEKFHSHTGFSA